MTQAMGGNGVWTDIRQAYGDAAAEELVTIDLINILDAIDTPIIVVRRDFTIGCFNRAATTMLGTAPTDIGGSPRDMPLLRRVLNLDELCAQVIATGTSSRCDFDNEGRRFVLRIAPYTKSDHQIAGTILTFTNVTAFSASINQAIYEREYTKAILNTVSEPLVVLSIDLGVQTANRAFYEMFEVSREGTQGLSIYELGNRALDVPGLRDQLQEAIFGNRAFIPFEVVQVCPAGHRTLLLDGRPLSLKGRPERMFLLSFQDITARKEAEVAKAKLAAIVESSDDAIVSKDLNGIIGSWNRGAEKLFGYAVEEMIGKSMTILIPPDRPDEEPGILDRIRRGERIAHYETVRRHKDGHLVEISLTVSPVRDTEGKITGASKIARDITERKLALARQELLAREIQHRTKNLFAVVQAVVSRSFTDKRTVKEAELAVLDRLHSLAQTHVMLIDKNWQGVDIGEVVRTEVSPFSDRVAIEGPPLILSAKAAQNFALAVHELVTNAAKYGALSNQTGRVHVSWSVFKPNGYRKFMFRWQERGGPPVAPPTRKGFGSSVLEQVMAEYFDTPPRIDFAWRGVSYELSGELEAISADPEDYSPAAATREGPT